MAESSNRHANDTDEPRKRLRAAVAELETRLSTLAPGTLRHDASNAVGAARNALALLEDESSGADPVRFIEMAQRNTDRARRLLSGELADTPTPRAESRRDEGDDLGRSREGDDGKAFGF